MHTVVDFTQCDKQILDDENLLESGLTEAILKCRGTVVKTVFHKFTPQGVTGVVIIAESHVTIHTWPEYGKACVDIFSCSHKLQIEDLIKEVGQIIKAKNDTRKTYKRG